MLSFSFCEASQGFSCFSLFVLFSCCCSSPDLSCTSCGEATHFCCELTLHEQYPQNHLFSEPHKQTFFSEIQSKSELKISQIKSKSTHATSNIFLLIVRSETLKRSLLSPLVNNWSISVSAKCIYIHFFPLLKVQKLVWRMDYAVLFTSCITNTTVFYKIKTGFQADRWYK